MKALEKRLVTVVEDDDSDSVELTLTHKQEAFAMALARHGNPAAAYRGAYNVREHTSLNVISVNASRLAAQPHVAKRVRELKQQAALELIVDIREALTHQLDIATANPNEIAYVAKRSCRHCYGIEYAYQWKDDHEYMQACIKAIDEKGEPPSDAGGFGYDRAKEPALECPNCLGAGLHETVINDTRKLSGKALKLFKGIDFKSGEWVVQMHDQQKAWEMVCRMLGGFNDKLNLTALMGGTGKVEKLPDGAISEQEAARCYLTLLQ